MKKPLDVRRMLVLSLLFALYFAVPFLLSTFLGYQVATVCLTALILLLLTWILYRREGRGLSEVGLDFSNRNLSFLPLGMLTGIAFFCVLFFAQMTHNGIQIHFNPRADYFAIAKGLFVLLPAVLVEELVFRGYCFKKTVDEAGALKANVIFAFLFMVWHWIAFDAWGDFGTMFGLSTTALGHLLFSTALLRSGTLYFPLGIHLGNNWTAHYFFSANTKGVGAEPPDHVFFIVEAPVRGVSEFNGVVSYMITFIWFVICILIVLSWGKEGRAI